MRPCCLCRWICPCSLRQFVEINSITFPINTILTQRITQFWLRACPSWALSGQLLFAEQNAGLEWDPDACCCCWYPVAYLLMQRLPDNSFFHRKLKTQKDGPRWTIVQCTLYILQCTDKTQWTSMDHKYLNGNQCIALSTNCKSMLDYWNQTCCLWIWVLIVGHSLMKDKIGGDKGRSESVSWQSENEIGSDKQGSAVRPTCNTKRHRICSSSMDGGIIVLVCRILGKPNTPFFYTLRSWGLKIQAFSTFCHKYCIPNIHWILWAIPGWSECALL